MNKIEKYLKLFFYMMVFTIPLAFVQRSEDAYYLPKMIVLAGGFQYVVLILFNARRISTGFTDKILIGFLVLYGVGLFTGVNKFQALIRYFEWVLAASLYFYAKYFLHKRDAEKVILIGLISGVFASVYALAQVFGVDFSGWVTDFSGRAFSTFGNPDFLGGFLLLIIPLSMIMFCYYKQSIAANILFIFLSGVLLLSQTRSSMAALFITVVIMVMYFRKFMIKSLKILIPGALVILLIVIMAGKHDGISKRLRSMSDLNDSGLTGRVEMWKSGLNMVKNNMFSGVGIYGVQSEYYLYKSKKQYLQTDRLHNDYIEIAAESGVLPLLLFLSFIVMNMTKLIRQRRTTANIIVAAVAGLLVHAFFNFPFYLIPTKVYFFVLLGAALNLKEESVDIDVAHFGAAALSSAIVIIIFLRFLTGSMYLNYGINYFLAKQNNRAKSFVEKSMSLYPFEKKYYYMSEILANENKYDEASEYIYKYLKVIPASKQGNVHAAVIAAEKKDYKKSLLYLNTFLKYYPQDVDVLNNKGKVLYLKGDTKSAIKTYNMVLEKEPENMMANYNLYGIYFNTGDKKKAEVMHKRIELLKKK